MDMTRSRKEETAMLERILIIDDDPDVTTTFKVGIETAIITLTTTKQLKFIHITIPLTAASQNSNLIFMISTHRH